MGNMYKETISRKKLFSIIKLLAILVFILFIGKAIEIELKGNEDIRNIVVLLSCIIVMVMIMIEIFRCRIKYTYYIIANQFIIHRIDGKDDKVVEDIKLGNIEHIYERKFVFTKRKIYSCNQYVINIFKLKTHCCIYKDGKELKRFYFDASKNLIEKIKFYKVKRD